MGALTDHIEDAARWEERQRTASQWNWCRTVLEEAIDRVGEKKALAVVEAALKKVK